MPDELRDELPRTVLGKVSHRQLKAEAAQRFRDAVAPDAAAPHG